MSDGIGLDGGAAAEMRADWTALDWAKEYVERGWWVFPVHGIRDDGSCTCGLGHAPGSKEGERDKGKHPVATNGLRAATRDLEKLEAWWGSTQGREWNIGLRTGEISGVTVLDVDVGEGKAGGETWNELVAEKGEPDTLMALTGSGGMHALFHYNSALKTSSNTLGPGIDCRNDGGYIVAPPSRHRSGKTYSWINWDDFLKGMAAGGMNGRLADLPPHLSKRVETRGRKKAGASEQRYGLADVEEMLKFVDPSDRDVWIKVGIILGREFRFDADGTRRADDPPAERFAQREQGAWNLYLEWASRWGGEKGRNHDETMREAFYVTARKVGTGAMISLGSLVQWAIKGGWTPDVRKMPREEFVFFSPTNTYCYTFTGSFWVAESVNALVGNTREDANEDGSPGALMKASLWIQKHRAATSMARLPERPDDVYIPGYDIRNGELFERPGSGTINTYYGPTLELGDARLAGPFLGHVRRVFNKPGDAEQFLNYMAHRVQRPAEKPRFALLIAGEMGTGKDTAIEMCAPAIGDWNIANIEPAMLDSGFNEHAAAVLVRISEAANLQDMTKWAFNEKLKVLIAGAPDHLTVNPKYGHKFSVRMFCGVIITTNHLMTGLFIPPNDRRYDVIEAATRQEMGFSGDGEETAERGYFKDLWAWFNADGGKHHVAAWLWEHKLGEWSASLGQRKTEAHKSVVMAGLTGDHWLLDAFSKLGDPAIVRGDDLIAAAEVDSGYTRSEIRGRLGAAMTRAGYWAVRCQTSKEGRWTVEDGNKVIVYARTGVAYTEVANAIPLLKKRF